MAPASPPRPAAFGPTLRPWRRLPAGGSLVRVLLCEDRHAVCQCAHGPRAERRRRAAAPRRRDQPVRRRARAAFGPGAGRLRPAVAHHGASGGGGPEPSPPRRLSAEGADGGGGDTDSGVPSELEMSGSLDLASPPLSLRASPAKGGVCGGKRLRRGRTAAAAATATVAAVTATPPRAAADDGFDDDEVDEMGEYSESFEERRTTPLRATPPQPPLQAPQTAPRRPPRWGAQSATTTTTTQHGCGGESDAALRERRAPPKPSGLGARAVRTGAGGAAASVGGLTVPVGPFFNAAVHGRRAVGGGRGVSTAAAAPLGSPPARPARRRPRCTTWVEAVQPEGRAGSCQSPGAERRLLSSDDFDGIMASMPVRTGRAAVGGGPAPSRLTARAPPPATRARAAGPSVARGAGRRGSSPAAVTTSARTRSMWRHSSTRLGRRRAPPRVHGPHPSGVRSLACIG